MDWLDRWREKRRRFEWYGDRNYNAFAILADVRNGYGFAGCDTGDGFVPISTPKGFPDDMCEEVRKIFCGPWDDENEDDDMSIVKPPLYKEGWPGKSLIDDFKPGE